MNVIMLGTDSESFEDRLRQQYTLMPDGDLLKQLLIEEILCRISTDIRELDVDVFCERIRQAVYAVYPGNQWPGEEDMAQTPLEIVLGALLFIFADDNDEVALAVEQHFPGLDFSCETF